MYHVTVCCTHAFKTVAAPNYRQGMAAASTPRINAEVYGEWWEYWKHEGIADWKTRSDLMIARHHALTNNDRIRSEREQQIVQKAKPIRIEFGSPDARGYFPVVQLPRTSQAATASSPALPNTSAGQDSAILGYFDGTDIVAKAPSHVVLYRQIRAVPSLHATYGAHPELFSPKIADTVAYLCDRSDSLSVAAPAPIAAISVSDPETLLITTTAQPFGTRDVRMVNRLAIGVSMAFKSTSAPPAQLLAKPPAVVV